MAIRTTLFTAVSLLGLLHGVAVAQSASPAAAPSPAAPASAPPSPAAPAPTTIVVTASRLNAARETIEPSLGATDYSVTNAAIQTLPGGDNQQLNQVVLQLPGVVQDSFGQIHVRDDHNGIQYRINGVILPEGISVFGQTLSPRLVEKLDLLTGALPAQYGLQTAGIINITTKSGVFNNGGEVSVYGGSHGTYEPSFEYGGSVDGTNFFVAGDFRRTQLGIENPDGGTSADHDRSDNGGLFAYLDRVIGDNDRVSLIAGYSNDRFQIPNTPGLEPALGLNVNGQTQLASVLLNDTQRETTGYGILSYLHDQGPFTVQTSLFTRYSTLTYRPDADLGDLFYNGISQAAQKKDFAAGVQSEAVYRLNDAHTIRAGVIIQGERATSTTSSQVLPVNGAGVQTTDMPETIVDDGAKTQWTYSVYLQDEWKILEDFVLNYGLRADDVNGYRDEKQLSPRINAVWTPLPGLAIHGGYARYFNPPPFELVGGETVTKFAATTAGTPVTQDTEPYAERQNYYDVGFEQKLLGRSLTLGIDSFYRQSKDLIDEGQFGAPIIQTPFNYASGIIKGVEFSANYAKGPFTAYANFTIEQAKARDIVSSQFNFSAADLAYIQGNSIFLDHNQTYTGSAGISYAIRSGFFEGAKVSGDLLYGSGLRRDGAVPNGDSLAPYTQVNLSVSHKFDLPYLQALDVRFDVINAFDKVYEIRDGTGVGVGAPQFGARRGFFAGITKSF
jgi:outer membrane receptor protein involved in Fe transport